jgi:hypothetical protein
MADRVVSQKTIIELKKVFEIFVNRQLNYSDLLYANDFPDWFVIQAQQLGWDWSNILLGLRRGGFFFREEFGMGPSSIVPNRKYDLTEAEALSWGEVLIRRLTAFATKLPRSEPLLRSLQLDGFDVDKDQLRLVPLEGSVSAQEEGDRLTSLVKATRLPGTEAILRHIGDAQSLYKDGKDHPSLNESRNFIQALIDGISVETDQHGKHTTRLAASTKDRIEYLLKVSFLAPDEEAALKSGWGTLSAGSHPGVPERELARIGLILALEFGQLLMLKFTNWKSNSYQTFS